MYKILIKHNSDKKNNLWMVYGNTITTTSGSSTTTTFTEFSTEDVDVLKAELTKLYAEFGTSVVKVIEEVEVVCDVEIVSDETEEDTTEPSEPTDPDDTTSDGDDTP